MNAPRSEHPWVLVEGDGPEALAAEYRLRQLGYEVCVCRGPTEERSCPLLAEGDCRLVEAAEVVVNALGDQDPGGQISMATRTASGAAVLRLGSHADDSGREHRRDRVERVTTAKLVRGLRVALALSEAPRQRPSTP